MGKYSRRENKGSGYITWASSSKAVGIPSRQQTRLALRIARIAEITRLFGGEPRAKRRILALDSIRKHKKGV